MTDTDDPEHDRDLFSLDEGDEATLTLDDGSTVDVTVTEKTRHNDERGPNITEQTQVTMERDDGERLMAGVTDGISGIPDADPFPSFFPLHEVDGWSGPEVPDDAVLGYVTGVDA